MLNGLFGDPWSPENLKYLPIKERRRLWKLRKNNVNKEPAQESQQAEIETEHGQEESQTFLPEGATFDFSRLAVEPGHGDRPNKKKLKEEIRGKVKTKGKPNKHLEANKSDFDQYGYYVAEDILSNENRENQDVVIGGAAKESSIFADDHLPLVATELPQTVDDRELNMVPEEIIRKEVNHFNSPPQSGMGLIKGMHFVRQSACSSFRVRVVTSLCIDGLWFNLVKSMSLIRKCAVTLTLSPTYKDKVTKGVYRSRFKIFVRYATSFCIDGLQYK